MVDGAIVFIDWDQPAFARLDARRSEIQVSGVAAATRANQHAIGGQSRAA
jgi:hypothetical protein